jgi:hypothetical protein
VSSPAVNTNYTAFRILSSSLHYTTLTKLTPSTLYYYKVGDAAAPPTSSAWSSVYSFTTAPALGAPSYPVSFLAYGDMGISNSQATANLTAKLIQSQAAQFIVHAGDISYADDRASINNGTIYDGVINDYFNEIQGASAYAPYMLSSGNHEAILDFLAYRTRVSPTMPTTSDAPFWYTFSYGGVFFLAFDQDQDWQVGSPQYTFIVNALAAVDRRATPWVVAFNHFPLLCSNYFWCPDATRFREVFEPVFNDPKTKVDLFLAGHVHAAEILYPNVNGTVVQANFTNVPTVQQVMVGFPGDIEVCCNQWIVPAPAYSYWRDDDVAKDGGFFGFTQVTVANLTHMRVQIWDSVNATVVKDLWISRAVPSLD